ncbi:MAG: insulinase family protein [Nitrospiraceae bacterium]|nr:MAG: insulinase family protein [Nitrospiraceae bacterium]
MNVTTEIKRTCTMVLLAGLLALCGPASAGEEAAGTETVRADGAVYEETLPNGMQVFIITDRSTPLAVFEVWYNAGSIHEKPGKTGLSHLLEHMMFKGTPSHGAGSFSKMIKRVGGIDNAGTGKDYAFYFQKLAPDRLSLSVEMEADRMSNLIMDPQETLSERNVVMEERRMRYDDDPQNLVYEEVMAAAFKNHPYRWPTIGWMSDLKTITHEDLLTYYRTRYVPNNAFIVAAGNIDVDSLMALIRKDFGRIPSGDPVRDSIPEEPEQLGERRVFVRKEAELPYVFSAYKAPNILDEDSYALDVLSSVLSDGKSARIYKSLIDKKQIALSAGAGYSSIQKYPHLFYLYGTAMPGRPIEDVEKALYEEVENIKEEPPSEREVQKAKNQIESDFIMHQDNVYYQAMMLALFQMVGDWTLRDRYIDGIRRVTPADVQRVAKKYLVEDTRTVGVLIPVKNREAQ